MECSVVLRPTCTTRHSPVLRLCLSLRIQSRPSPLSAEQMTHEYMGRTRPRKHQGRKRQFSQVGSFSRVHRRGPARVQRGSTYLGEEGGCETSSEIERDQENDDIHTTVMYLVSFTGPRIQPNHHMSDSVQLGALTCTHIHRQGQALHL